MKNTNINENNSRMQLEKYRECLNIALKAAKICVFEVDIKNQLYTFFENAEDIFGVSGERILNDVRKYSRLAPDEYKAAVSEYFSHPKDRGVIDKAFEAVFAGRSVTYEARMRAGGSDYIWCKLDIEPILKNGVPQRMIGVITNIANEKIRREELEEAVKTDHFTGLYDKQYSVDRIKRILQKYSDRRHVFVILDIDCLKKLNDICGHAAGDRAIKEVAAVMKRTLGSGDVIGRFGGDEFIALIRDVSDAEQVVGYLRDMIKYDDGIYCGTTSIGAAVFPDDGTDFDQLFENADRAMYQSKLARGKYTFYSEVK